MAKPLASRVFIAIEHTPNSAEGVVVDFSSGELYAATRRMGDQTVVVKDGGIRAKVLGLTGDFEQTQDGQVAIVADFQIALRSTLQGR